MTHENVDEVPVELDAFEERLVAALQAQFAGQADLELLPGGGTSPRRVPSGIRVPAAAFVTALVLITATVFLTGHDEPAYAVTKAANGDVVVTIHSDEDAEGLEHKLRGLGVTAQISFGSDAADRTTGSPAPPRGHPNEGSPATVMVRRALPMPIISRSNGDWVVTIPRSTLHRMAVLQMYLSAPGSAHGCCAVSFVRWVSKTG